MTENESHLDDATFERASDFVDGELSPAQRVVFERELEQSATLRGLVEELRAMQGRASALARELEPRRDLWPAVERRVTAQDEDVIGRALRWLAAPWGRVAAVGGAVAAAAIVFVVTGGQGESSPAGPVAVAPFEAPSQDDTDEQAAPPGPEVIVSHEREYLAAVASLSDVYKHRRRHIPVATLASFDAGLRVVDGAIGSARGALLDTPDSPELITMLDDAYEQKIDLLRQATELQEWSI